MTPVQWCLMHGISMSVENHLLLWSTASSLFNWHACTTSLKSSLFYLLVWIPPLHTPYTFLHPIIHYLLFATHAHTIAIGFAVVPRLCHLFLISLSLISLPGTLTSHIQEVRRTERRIHHLLSMGCLTMVTSSSFHSEEGLEAWLIQELKQKFQGLFKYLQGPTLF